MLFSFLFQHNIDVGRLYIIDHKMIILISISQNLKLKHLKLMRPFHHWANLLAPLNFVILFQYGPSGGTSVYYCIAVILHSVFILQNRASLGCLMKTYPVSVLITAPPVIIVAYDHRICDTCLSTIKAAYRLCKYSKIFM